MEQEALNKLRQLKALLIARSKMDQDKIPWDFAEKILILCDYFDFNEIGIEPEVLLGTRKWLVSYKLPNMAVVSTGDNLHLYKEVKI